MVMVPFIGPTNKSRSVNVSAERTVNYYRTNEGKYGQALFARPGLKSFTNTGAAEVRGMIVLGTALIVVVGGEVKSVDTGGSVTSLGNIPTSNSGPVGIAVNPTQVLIVDGVDGYICDGATVAVIADADFPNTCTHAAYIDSFFIVNDTSNPGRFYKSAENSGTGWISTEFATAERSPDNLKAICVVNREIWLFGDLTTEIWYNSGDPTFPFEQFPSGFVEQGIAAPYSVACSDGTVVWLSKNRDGQGIVMRNNGLSAVPISTQAVASAIASYSTISDAIGWMMQIEQHLFYVLTFPTADRTWVLDATMNDWFEWKTYNKGRWAPNAHVFFNSKHYVGDYQDGNLFELDVDTYDDNGTVFECIRSDRHMVSSNLRERVVHKSLEIEMEAGVGNAAVVDPQIMLRWSDDGGHTFSNEHWRALGKVGEYGQRAKWRQLGQSRDRIYETKVTDPVRRVLLAGFADISIGGR